VAVIRLGLIGDNIAASRAPELHRICGKLSGLTITYDLLVPKELKHDFDGLFDHAHNDGYRGLNITYPYKEKVVSRLAVDDASVKAISACNTVLFERPRPRGANTDYTGFIAAYRTSYGTASPGVVAVAGSGGVGKAIAFALAGLGAKTLHLFDLARGKSEQLKQVLAGVFPATAVHIGASIEQACDGADGLINCTPLGMEGIGGTAFPPAMLTGKRWAFDAVYTPVETGFIREARVAGVEVMTGYELFFYQGVEAFRIFTGCDIDAAALRKALQPLQSRVIA
jgi:quinate/shikimate dehydrogenase (NAD+)